LLLADLKKRFWFESFEWGRRKARTEAMSYREEGDQVVGRIDVEISEPPQLRESGLHPVPSGKSEGRRMSKTLQISSDLSLPLDAITHKFAILGTSGSGKSYTAMKSAELMLDFSAQIIAVDPVGIWWALRLAKDGKSDGYKQVVVFGGEHGDLPLTPESGALVARMLAERGIPAVLDVSQFISSEQVRFLAAFGEQFFESKKTHKSPVHLFLEECQTVVPEEPQRDENLMLNRWRRLIKFGRNYGVGVSLISQQPQAVDKKVLNECPTLFAMRTVGGHQRKAILNWVKDVIESESDLVSRLPKLPTGTAHLWSPEWLKVSRDIKILPRVTFDAGKTPEIGSHAVEPRPLTKIDVDQFKSSMSEMIERAKQDDPKELRAQIAKLKQEMAKRPIEQKIQVEEKIIEVPVVKPEQLEAFAKLSVQLFDTAAALTEAIRCAARKPMPATIRPRPAITPSPRPQLRPTSQVRPMPMNGHSDLSAAQIKVLSRLVELMECTGSESVKKEQLAAWAEYSPNSGGFNNYLGSLRSAGLIEYPSGGYVAITDEGRTHARPEDVPATSEEMLDRAKRVLGGSEGKLLELLHNSREQVSKTDLAEAGGFSPNSGGFNNYLGHMRTLGFVTYPQPGQVQCADWLYL
jgi:hypothetical protein